MQDICYCWSMPQPTLTTFLRGLGLGSCGLSIGLELINTILVVIRIIVIV